MSWRTLSTITIMKKRLVLLEANICVLSNRANLASAQPSQHKAFLGTSSTRCMMLV
jgi:hypothetical protein